MNRFFIFIAFCLCPLTSQAMEQPSDPTKDLSRSLMNAGKIALLHMFKDNTFQPVDIQEATIDFLPYFLEQCLKTCFASKWIPQKHIEWLQLGLQELKNHQSNSFTSDMSEKRLNRQKEKAIERANNHFTNAAQSFKKLCYIRCPNNNESYWEPRTMHFTPALYAHAYTAMALSEYNLAHESLIKAITIDHSYMVGGMSIELLMVLASKFNYKPSHDYIEKNKLILFFIQKHLPAKQQMIGKASTYGMAAANILPKIKGKQEIEEEQKEDQNNKKTLRQLNKTLKPRGLSILTTIPSLEYTTLVIETPAEPSRPLTGKQRRAEKRKIQQQAQNRK